MCLIKKNDSKRFLLWCNVKWLNRPHWIGLNGSDKLLTLKRFIIITMNHYTYFLILVVLVKTSKGTYTSKKNNSLFIILDVLCKQRGLSEIGGNTSKLYVLFHSIHIIQRHVCLGRLGWACNVNLIIQSITKIFKTWYIIVNDQGN